MSEENETFGPKKGIKISLNDADMVIRRHFPAQSVQTIEHVDRGYNNRVYIVKTTTSEEYILRLSGRFWKRCKTENEVAALTYLKAYYHTPPVPKVFGYCTDKEKSGINAEYILMEKLSGEPLENVWQSLGMEDKFNLVNQLAGMLSRIQSITFPKIGSFTFDPEPLGDSLGIGIDPQMDISEPKRVIQIGQVVDFKIGPFDSFLDYFRRTSEIELEFLRNCCFMKDSSGYDSRIERIERFIHAFTNIDTIPESICKKALVNVPFVVTHGDFEPRNILVDTNTVKVTGILDWEFSGSYPVDEEWFSGLTFLDANTAESVVSGEKSTDIILTESESENISLLREHFLQEMRNNRALTPDEMIGHTIRAELHHFKGLICPWWLRETRDPIPESHYVDKADACEKVDAVLSKYGF